MTAYDGNFRPPAPVAHVVVVSLETSESVANVPMLLDSGADVSLLPRMPIAHLLPANFEGEQYELAGFDGTRSSAHVVRLQLQFLERVFTGQFLLIDQDIGILGRNILNAIPLVFDGPNLSWHESV